MIPHSNTLLSGLILSFTIKFNCIHVYAHVLCLSVSMYICVQMSVEGRECFWFLGIGGTAGCMLYNMSAGNRPPVLSKSNACLPLISKPSFQLWLWFFLCSCYCFLPFHASCIASETSQSSFLLRIAIIYKKTAPVGNTWKCNESLADSGLRFYNQSINKKIICN